MVKSRKPSAPENEYNLDVISIGSIYIGPWNKKYWSSSRGNDRYPYPVGYQATRAYNGITCKMQILEGVIGPTFLISSDVGYSASGKTPHIAWAEFQKKGSTRIGNRNRHSPKMDALEVILRLLRQLVAAEQSLVSSNIPLGREGRSRPLLNNETALGQTSSAIHNNQVDASKISQDCIDIDLYVPDSDLDDMSPPAVCVPDSVLDDMSPLDVCVPDSDLDDLSPPDVCVPESDLDESPANDSFKSLQTDLPVAQDFTGEKTQDEAVDKIGNAKTLVISSSQSPNSVHTRRRRRRKRRNSVTLPRNYSAVESTECDKTELVTPQMLTARDSFPPSKTIEAKPDDSAGLILEKPEVRSDIPDVQNKLAELNLSSQIPNPFSCENKCSGGKEAQFISEPMVQKNQEVKNNLNGNVKFVGRYMHRMPISSVLLKTVEDGIHICVLCGLLTDQHKTLFTYKVAIEESNFGCPSFMAHTPIMLPDPKYNFMKETMVERSGVELTPDGQCIVLIGSIKTPNCRESKIDCCCSTCSSICSKKNGLKIVHVESGYASVVATLEAVEDLHCILVCEPNRLVSVGGSGSIQVWVMNSTWSEKIEYFSIPSVGSMSPGIVELKRVPKCAHLVVGRNIYGDFSLWDITKLNLVSSFSASKYPINEFLPVSLFPLQTKGLGLSYASIEEKAEKLLEASEFWHSKQRETCVYLPTEDVAMWFLVSTPSNFDCCQDHVSTSIHHDVHRARSWRLALLMENSIAFGSPLDPRTTAVGVSGGYGIFSTSDGVVYMWDLSRGSKLDTLHHFQGDTITSIVTDDLNSNSSVVGVVGEEGPLLLYLHLRDRDSNEERQ